MLSIEDLVEAGRTNREVYTNPEIFELEMQRIFGRAWIYVAHESQVRNKGDFVASRIGREKIIVARHDDGKIYAYFNRCTHRGAEVCVDECGNTRAFVCPYHAWTFRTDGSLAGVPHGTGYGPNLQKKIAGLGLERLPRVSSYRGFIFASRAREGIGLEEFLGDGVRDVFDNFVDRSPSGELEVGGGKLVQCFRANWKMQIENSIDLLHPSILHRNAIDSAKAYSPSPGASAEARISAELSRVNGLTFKQWDDVGICALPNGHCYMGGFLQKSNDPADDEGFGSDDNYKFPGQADYKAALVRRHGRQKAEEVLAFNRHNTIVYPNLFVNPRIQQVRILQPIAFNRTEQHCFIFRLIGAPPEMFHVAVRIVTAANSPASIVTTDDHEIFEQMQAGLSRGDLGWVDLSRGLGDETNNGVGRRAPGTSELLMRNQHEAWLTYMREGSNA